MQGYVLKAGNASEQNLDSLLWEIFDAESASWALSDRELFTYDASGNILSEIVSVLDEDELKFVHAYKEEYLYEDGKLTSLNEYVWEEGEWVLFYKTTYTYNSSGNLEEELSQFWEPDDEAGFDYGKTLYTYNEDNKLILEERWDEGSTKNTNSWINTSKSEWSFNKDYTISEINAAYWFFLDQSNITFVHMPVSELVYIYVDDNWVMDSRQSAYYSDFGAYTGIEDRAETSLKSSLFRHLKH